MTTSQRDTSAAALLLVAFGLAPWVDGGVWLCVRDDLEAAGRDTQTLFAFSLAISLAIGAIAAFVSLGVGIAGWRLAAREKCRRSLAAPDAPRKASGRPRTLTNLARGAAMLAIVGVWGPAGVVLVEAIKGGPAALAWWGALLTLSSVVSGFVMLLVSRGRRPPTAATTACASDAR